LLKANRTNGGLVEHLLYENITMVGVQHPILLTSYYNETTDPVTDPAQSVVATTPFWKDIVFKNITIAGGDKNSVEIYGLAEAPMDSITFSYVSITAKTAFIVDHAHDVVFENTTYNGSSSLASLVSSQSDATMRVVTTGLAGKRALVPAALQGLRVDPLGRPLGSAAYGMRIGISAQGTGSATEWLQVRQ